MSTTATMHYSSQDGPAITATQSVQPFDCPYDPKLVDDAYETLLYDTGVSITFSKSAASATGKNGTHDTCQKALVLAVARYGMDEQPIGRLVTISNPPMADISTLTSQLFDTMDLRYVGSDSGDKREVIEEDLKIWTSKLLERYAASLATMTVAERRHQLLAAFGCATDETKEAAENAFAQRNPKDAWLRVREAKRQSEAGKTVEEGQSAEGDEAQKTTLTASDVSAAFPTSTKDFGSLKERQCGAGDMTEEEQRREGAERKDAELNTDNGSIALSTSTIFGGLVGCLALAAAGVLTYQQYREQSGTDSAA